MYRLQLWTMRPSVCCPVQVGTRRWVAGLGLREVSPWRPWLSGGTSQVGMQCRRPCICMRLVDGRLLRSQIHAQIQVQIQIQFHALPSAHPPMCTTCMVGVVHIPPHMRPTGSYPSHSPGAPINNTLHASHCTALLTTTPTYLPVCPTRWAGTWWATSCLALRGAGAAATARSRACCSPPCAMRATWCRMCSRSARCTLSLTSWRAGSCDAWGPG